MNILLSPASAGLSRGLKKLLFLLTILAMPALSLAQGVPELMYFRFDQNIGGATPNDAPPATRAGTALAPVTGLTIGGTGQFGAGLLGTAGASSSNNVNTGWTTNFPGSWTISMWLNVPVPATTRYYFGDVNATSLRCFTGGVAGNGLRLTGPTGLTFDIPNIQPTPVVVHYVYNGATGVLSAYLNGVFSNSASIPSLVISGAGPFYVGGYSGTNGSVEGAMDEFRFYNRALTTTEITKTWNKPLPIVSGPNNASAAQITEPVNFCQATLPVKLKVKNNGNNLINTLKVNWLLDGVAQPQINVNTPIDTFGSIPGNELIVTLGNVTFAGAARTIKAWTSLPNNMQDTVNGDDTVNVTLQAALNGIYTVGGTTPDFATLADAAAALNTYGVCGPVTMNIRSGTYTNQQASLSNIPGTSTVNRVTFKSEANNAASVIFNSANTTAAGNYIFSLNSTSYVTIKDLTLNPTNATYARGVALNSSCSRDSVLNCIINVPAGVTSTNEKAGIAVVGLNANNVFKGNTINNASYGIYQYGDGTTALADGNVYDGNVINNPYAYGIYAYYNKNLKFRNNTITRAAAAGTFYGFFSYYGDDAQDVSGNIITVNGATGAAYGINMYYTDANTNVYATVSNNVINLTSTLASFGLRMQYNSYTNCLNNTVRVAAGATVSYASYMYYSSTIYTPNNVHNNIFWNDGTGGAAYYNYSSSFITSDFNNSFGGATLFQAGTPAQTTNSLADWRNSTGLEKNSICYRPGLVSTTNLMPNPADTAVWSIHGRGLQVAGNNTDITGAARPTTLAAGVPDLGAYEFVPTALPPVAIAVPAVSAPGTSQAFTFGQDTVAVLNWGATSVVPLSLAVRQYSGIVPTGLPAGSFMYFYTDVALTGTGLNYTSNIYYKDPWKGTSPISEGAIRMASKNGAAAWISYPGAASSIEVNRNILTVANMTTTNWFTGRVDNCTGTPVAATITNPPVLTPFCAGQTAFLTASDNTNTVAGITYRWQSAPSATGPWTNINGATNLSFTTPALTATTWFRIVDTCVPSNQGAASAAYQVPVANPQIVSTTPASRCGPGTVTLSATGGPTTSLRWFTTATGGASVFNGASFTTPSLTATTTYYVEAFEGLCTATPRQAVTATVTPAPAFNVTDSMVVCNNAPATLSVTSPLANYNSFIWTPNTNLFTDAAGTIPYTGTSATTLYFKTNVSGLYTVIVNANNSASLCASADTLKVYVLPDSTGVALNALPDTICVSGTTTLSLNPSSTYASSLIRWYWSGNGSVYTQIPGASGPSYTSGTIFSDTFFRVRALNTAGDICLSKDKFIYRNNPQVLTTVPGTRCGPGTVALAATGSPGTTLNWYTTLLGGLPVFSGSNYTTPILPATTTFYVSAGSSGSGGTNKDSITTTFVMGNGCGGGVMFNITPTVNIVIDSFLGYWSTGGLQPAQVYFKVGSYVGFETTPAAWTAVGAPLTINAVASNPTYINPGATIVMNAGTTYGVYLNYYSSYTNGLNVYTNADMTLSAGAGLCAQFGSIAGDRTFNGRVLYHKGASCESARVPVTATVTPSNLFTVTDTQSVCNNAPATLTVTSPTNGYDQVTWTPIANLYTDPAATTFPYVFNTNASTVYSRTTTPGYYAYRATGLNTTNNCQGMDTAVVFTQPLVTAIAASPDTLCFSGSSTLTIAPTAPYFANSLSWFNSINNGATYNPIAGATAISYTTPVINDTTWYRIRVKNSAGVTCQDFNKQLIVKIPTITDTNNKTRCGVGGVTLEATALPGYNIDWYTVPSGGNSIFTGPNFTTPTLFNTTTYYVDAGNGGSPGTVGPLNPQVVGTNANTTTTYNVFFTVNVPTTLLSVDVFPGTAAIGTASTIQLWDATTAMQTQSVSYVTTVTGGATPQTIPLNFVLPPGNYYLKPGTSISLQRNSAGVAYPYTSPAINITGNSFLATYYVHFYNWKYTTGCRSARIPVTATVNPAPQVTVTPKIDSICYGQSAMFTAASANPGYRYTWNPVQVPGPVLSIQPGATTTYYLYAFDTTNNPVTKTCAFYDTVKAVVLPNPIADVIPLSTTTFCAGDSVRLKSPFASDYTYQWKRNGVNMPGALDSTIIVTAAGSYTVQVKKAGFCTTLSDPELVTVNPLPNPTIGISNGILNTGAFNSYQWLRNGLTILGATGQQYVPTQNGDYTVAVTDANGCSNTSSIWRVSNTGVAIVNGIGGAVVISPNPTTGVMTIKAPVKVNAVVTTLDGRVVLRQDGATRVDLTGIADGVYFLRVLDAADGALLKSEKILKAE